MLLLWTRSGRARRSLDRAMLFSTKVDDLGVVKDGRWFAELVRGCRRGMLGRYLANRQHLQIYPSLQHRYMVCLKGHLRTAGVCYSVA